MSEFLWLNGAFGAGKSSVATELVATDPRWRIFDPEFVGFMLRAQFPDSAVVDFQDFPSWRRLVPIVADDLARETGKNLVIVQTVLRMQYWDELAHGFHALGHRIHHVVLDAPADVLRRRINQDEVLHRAAGWRMQHIPAYLQARDWLTDVADLVIDTTSISAVRAAAQLAEATRRWATDDTPENDHASSA